MTRAKAKRKAPVKEYLSPTERENLQSEKRDLENTLKDMEGYGIGTAGAAIDKSAITREISMLGNAIDERTAPTPRAVEKDRLVKEEKSLEDAIALGMPTWYEMNKPTRNPGAVRKHMAWSDRNKLNIKRYRQVQRILRPLDPKSIESLRKER